MRVLTDQIAIGARASAEDGSTTPGLALLTLVLGTILLVRVVGILVSGTDLHYEEAQYWFWSRDLDLGYYSRPPVYMWLIGLATAICGDGEVCVRMPSPIVATAGAYVLYALAARLYDGRVAFWAAVVYATLPAISVFALAAMPEVLVSFFLIAGLLVLSIHLDRPTALNGLLLGAVLGVGLNTDYTVIYLPICSVLFIAATPPLRHVLRAPGTWLALAVAALLVAPNLLWNARNEFIAFEQVANIADWSFRRFNPDNTLLFIALQFVMFGPILLFVVLRSVVARTTMTPRPTADRFLVYHSVPILVALLIQSFFFKARAHWALPAYPAAAVFVTALLLRHGFNRLLLVSTGLHVAALAGILAMGYFAERFTEAPSLNRLVGWHRFAEELEKAAAVSDIKTVVLQGGSQVSETLYYLRDSDLEILAFNPRGRSPGDDFEMRRSWAYGDPETVLLATPRDPAAFGIPLGTADKIGEFAVPPYLSRERVFSLYRVNPPADTDLPQ